MVTAKHTYNHGDERTDELKPEYWVMAKITEPKYDAEARFILAERLIIERKLRHHRRWFKHYSSPKFGIFSRDDWHDYADELDSYERRLAKYRASVKDSGILPVKFAVYNNTGRPDHDITIKVGVHYGKIDTKKVAPTRPTRLDGAKPGFKLNIPHLEGDFRRRGISVTPHTIAAEFTALNARDGAALINQLVHVHCGPETRVQFAISSHNVARIDGDVEI